MPLNTIMQWPSADRGKNRDPGTDDILGLYTARAIKERTTPEPRTFSCASVSH